MSDMTRPTEALTISELVDKLYASWRVTCYCGRADAAAADGDDVAER